MTARTILITTMLIALAVCAGYFGLKRIHEDGVANGKVIGIAQEDARIIATCMDDNAKTVINGTTYECLSPELSEANRNALMLLKRILERAARGGPEA